MISTMSTSVSRMIFFQNYFKLKAQIKEIKDIIVNVKKMEYNLKLKSNSNNLRRLE